jgi:hypothetical protein
MPNPFETALEASAKMSINAAAKMTGMEPEDVAAMLADSLPKAMEAAKASPEAAAGAIKQSVQAMPVPVQAAYEKMGATASAQGASAQEMASMFGAQTKALEEAAASMAGTTTEKAGAVLGAAVPAVKDAMAKSAAAAGQAAGTVDPAKAQELLGQAAQATASVFGRLAGRGSGQDQDA